QRPSTRRRPAARAAIPENAWLNAPRPVSRLAGLRLRRCETPHQVSEPKSRFRARRLRRDDPALGVSSRVRGRAPGGLIVEDSLYSDGAASCMTAQPLGRHGQISGDDPGAWARSGGVSLAPAHDPPTPVALG